MDLSAFCWPLQLTTSHSAELPELIFSVCVVVEKVERVKQRAQRWSCAFCLQWVSRVWSSQQKTLRHLMWSGLFWRAGTYTLYKTFTLCTGKTHANLSLFICVVQSWRLLEMLKRFTITIRVALGNSSSFISASKETFREEGSQTVSSTESYICVPNWLALLECVYYIYI